MKTGYIYALLDSETQLVRYIGQTRITPKTRFNKHKYKWKRVKGKLSHVDNWIKSLYEKGLFPILEEIESNISIKNLDWKEIEYIKLFKSFGADLTNHQKGGIVDDNYNILEEFLSVKQAAEKCGIKDSTHIVRVCKGKNKSGKTYGLRFIYKPKPAKK